jgi:hypothetical protein
MKTSMKSSTCPALFRSALIALGFALGLAVVAIPALKAADAAMADKALSLPLTATFEKVAGAETAPYVLTLKNDSMKAVNASAKILLAVAFHAEAKARNVPECVIDPGKTCSIKDLAAGDRVVVSAKGFAPLELTVK